MIFIDTGAFLARYLHRDQHHEQAISCWKELASSKQQTFTSNFVLDELFTLLGRKADYLFAAKQATIILSSSHLNILRPDISVEKTAVEYLKKYADQQISYTDCISFVLMKQRGIKQVFSFDHHFERVGLKFYNKL
jgi:predicted nucleic acid-binding protein